MSFKQRTRIPASTLAQDLADGLSVQAMADKYHRSYSGVYVHLRRAYAETGAKTNTELVSWGFRHGGVK